jgi:hypothetical protein
MKRLIALVLGIIVTVWWGCTLTPEKVAGVSTTPTPAIQVELARGKLLITSQPAMDQEVPSILVTELEAETQTYTYKLNENNQRVYTEAVVLPAGMLVKITPVDTEFEQIEYPEGEKWIVAYIKAR